MFWSNTIGNADYLIVLWYVVWVAYIYITIYNKFKLT